MTNLPSDGPPFKATKITRTNDASQSVEAAVRHPTLSLYYKRIQTLRDFLLEKTPQASKTRRRRIAKAGLACSNSLLGDQDLAKEHAGLQQADTAATANPAHSSRLASVLDKTLVCRDDIDRPNPIPERAKDLDTFSQHLNLTSGSGAPNPSLSQQDLVEFAVWLLFNRVHRHVHRPPHMLCHGYQRAQAPRSSGEDHYALAGIPGIVAHYPNSNINTLKSLDWAGILAILGKDGERVMLDLLLDTDIFSNCSEERGNFIQLCGEAFHISNRETFLTLAGTPLSDRQPLKTLHPHELTKAPILGLKRMVTDSVGESFSSRSPSAIIFVRSRIFYARAALNAKGNVTFGLRHIRKPREYAWTLRSCD